MDQKTDKNGKTYFIISADELPHLFWQAAANIGLIDGLFGCEWNRMHENTVLVSTSWADDHAEFLQNSSEEAFDVIEKSAVVLEES